MGESLLCPSSTHVSEIPSLSAKVFHIPLILSTPSFQLSAIVQRTPTPENDATKDHPSITLHRTTDSLLADPNIDIIIITTPPSSHYALCVSGLEAGKHILVEKPFVPTAAEAHALLKLSRAKGKQLCVYQNRRWDTDFLTLKQIVKDGTIGRIVELETHFDRYKPAKPETWKGQSPMVEGGGVVYDLGTHMIDQVYLLFGMPETVFAVFAVQRGGIDASEPDSITILLGYGPAGPLVTVKAGVLSVEKEQLRFWARGEKGSWKKFGLDVQEDQLKKGMKPADEGFGVERAGTLIVLDAEGKPKEEAYEMVVPETYIKLYEGFAKAVDGGDEADVPVKAAEAADVLRIIEAARESAVSGGVVTL